METEKLKEKILSLPTTERDRLLKKNRDTIRTADLTVHASRRHELDNKMGSCPHCSHKKYIRQGTDNGVQRYKCKSCNRGFTEYTGTWIAGFQRRDKVGEYLKLMINENSLDKISAALGINKKTAFDWRHKILASLVGDGGEFTGITESGEFFSFGLKRAWR
ncbi:transposase-like protein [Salegentibacter salegens]|nr:transposase-like protein [Salegentibacter salegens]